MKTFLLILSLAIGSFLISKEDTVSRPVNQIEEISAPGMYIESKNNEQFRLNVHPIIYDSAMHLLALPKKSDRC